MSRRITTAQLYEALLGLKEATEIGFTRVDQRFDRLEKRMTSNEGRIAGLERGWNAFDTRLGNVEGQIGELRVEMRAGFAAQSRRFELLEQR